MATEESSSCGSIQLASLASSTITTRERFKLCCKLTYKPRLVKNKGAILVLVWNYLIMNYFVFLIPKTNEATITTFVVWLVGFGLVPPIAGWLADAHTGRYKMIRWSFWIMWTATVIATASSVVVQFVDNFNTANTYIFKCLTVTISIGFGAYQANIIQFGIDQLNDASTTEITSFILWYAMTVINGGSIMDIAFACLDTQYDTIRNLFVCLNITLALVSMLCFNHWLIKEPVKQNPFKLVYRVIRYAIKTKHPRCRSAFTYCEDELPSRIDFGKNKYGGPFTTEQVEDVKTVLRLIPLVIVGGAVAGGVVISNYFRGQLSDQFTKYGKSFDPDYVSSSKELLKECYYEASYTHVFYYIIVVLIVIHEVLLYPTLQRCCRIKSGQKILIGLLLQIIRLFMLMAFDIISRHHFLQEDESNTGIVCLFCEKHGGTLMKYFDYRWIAIPDFLQSASLVMFYIGTVEFVSAQAPYFIKGVTIGVTYCSVLVSIAIWTALSIPFHQKWSAWSRNKISCGFWYTLMLVIIQMCIFMILTILTLWYKRRRRQDVLPNEHFFAERYYSTNNSKQSA